MRIPRTLAIALCCLTLGAAACGGGSPTTESPDSAKIPTATLPAELPPPTIVGGGAVQPGGGAVYSVKSGDTLATIAERFGVSLEDLLAANPGIDPRTLQTGDTVRLPTGTAPTTPEPSPTAGKTVAPETPTPRATEAPATETPEATEEPDATATAPAGSQTYTVQAGDIPGSIAAKFGITVEALLAANPGIDPTNLQIGEVLIIPPPP